MAPRYKDWIGQAAADLKAARTSRGGGSFEWACFAAQQGAEKAVKGLILSLNGDPWGHAILKLLQDCQDVVSVPADVIDCGRRLDRFYIPTRYPNGFDAGKPADYFTDEDARGAIQDAERILQWVEDQVP